MPNGFKKLMDQTFGTPAEGIKTLRELTGGETGKQLNLLRDTLKTSTASFKISPGASQAKRW